MSTSKFLYGIHDPGGEHILSGRGWVVFTETADGQPGDYRRYADQGLGVIVRLNHGYGKGTGTIPTPDRYAEFAQRCAAWVAASQGVEWLVIGNEIAHYHEWPTDQPITLASYLDCYRQCYKAIKAVAPNVKIAPQAVAPWNASTPDAPDWILQLRQMLLALDGMVDWICLHAYTRGYTPSAFVTGAVMDAPWNYHYSGWETLWQFMAEIPLYMRHLPVMVTEANGNQPWATYQAGWVQALYQQIEQWNAKPGNQQIRCVALFRWARHDSQWDMSQCNQAHDDLRSAVALGYQWREAQPQVLPAPEQWTGYVTASPFLRLRAEPNTTSNVLVEVVTGEKVTVTGQRDGWLQVNYGALTGWMLATWVSRAKPTINNESTQDQRSAIIAKLAAEYGVDERVAKAVIKIESGGSGFRNGRLIMRFEPHVFKARFNALFAEHFQMGDPAWNGDGHRVNVGGEWKPFHGNQDMEYQAQLIAADIAERAAFDAASYGAGQIMGFNHAACGYSSAKAMAHEFQQSEEAQLRAMFQYFKHSGALACLVAGDLVGFAKIYNGPGQAQFYANKIREAMR
jgi:hypothetical protein